MEQKIKMYRQQLLEEIVLDFSCLQNKSFVTDLQQSIVKNRIFKNLHQYPDCQDNFENSDDDEELWSSEQNNKLKAKLQDIFKQLKSMGDTKYLELVGESGDASSKLVEKLDDARKSQVDLRKSVKDLQSDVRQYKTQK